MIAKTFRPSQRAFEQARKLARYAAKHDNWMRPVAEWKESESTSDYGSFETELIDGWEETTQFQILYGSPLSHLAEQQSKRFGIDKHDGERSWEIHYYQMYCPLRDEFWREWCEKKQTLRFWREFVENK